MAKDKSTNKQNSLMRFDPQTCASRPYPSLAAQYRTFHGTVVWKYNPYTGQERTNLEIGQDVLGETL